MDVFIAGLYALEGDYLSALRRSAYQAMPTLERLEVISIASLLQVYCALALEDAAATELHLKRAIKLLKPMSEEPYFRAIRDYLQRKPSKTATALLGLVSQLSHTNAPGFFVERVNTLLPLVALGGERYDCDAFKANSARP